MTSQWHRRPEAQIRIPDRDDDRQRMYLHVGGRRLRQYPPIVNESREIAGTKRASPHFGEFSRKAAICIWQTGSRVLPVGRWTR